MSGSAELFPSLEMLGIGSVWLSKENSDALHLLRLMPPTLQHLELCFETSLDKTPEPYFVYRFLWMVAQKVPALRRLDLDSTESLATAAKAHLLLSLTQGYRLFKLLEEIALPSAWINLEFLQMLSTLPQLKNLNEECDNGAFQVTLDDLKSTKPGAFPSLVNATLSGPLPLVRRLLSSLFSGCSLTTFDIFVSVYDTSTTEQGLLDCLSDTARTFRELTSVGIYYVRQHPPHLVEKLSKACLEPLSQLPNMRDFEVRHPEHLLMTEDDVEDIAQWWPKMERLCLNSCTVPWRGSSLTNLESSPFSLRVLEKILFHLPRLRFLSIDCNCRTQDLGQATKQFAHCKLIHLGFSFVDIFTTPFHINRAAIYLSSLLWENYKITYSELDDVSPEVELAPHELLETLVDKRRAAVQDLIKAVRLCTDVRQAEQELKRLLITS